MVFTALPERSGWFSTDLHRQKGNLLWKSGQIGGKPKKWALFPQNSISVDFFEEKAIFKCKKVYHNGEKTEEKTGKEGVDYALFGNRF